MNHGIDQLMDRIAKLEVELNDVKKYKEAFFALVHFLNCDLEEAIWLGGLEQFKEQILREQGYLNART